MSCQVDKSVLQVAIKGRITGTAYTGFGLVKVAKDFLYHQNKERPALHENPNTRTRAMYDDTTRNTKNSSFRRKGLKMKDTNIRSDGFQGYNFRNQPVEA